MLKLKKKKREKKGSLLQGWTRAIN